MKRSDIFIKNGKPSIRFDIENHMETLFKRHEKDGFTLCGYDWCSIIICFIDINPVTKEIWREFDYIPSNENIVIIANDKQSLNTFIKEFDKVCNDERYIEQLMSLIDYS